MYLYDMYNRLDIIPACDRQTSCDGIVRAMHRHRAVKIEETYHVDSSFDHKLTSSIIIILTSSAVAERPRDASCH